MGKNSNANGHKILVESLRLLGSPEIGKENPDEPKDNHCACPFSAYALAEEWSTLVTELLQDPLNIVTKMPERSHHVSYYARQMDKYCQLDGLLNRMLSTFGEDSVKLLRKDLDSKLPGGIANIDRLTDEQLNEVLKGERDEWLITLSMMLQDARTILRNCSSERE